MAGAVGALIAIPMSKTIGTASYVLLIGTGILLTIFTFGIKPAELVDRISERIQESREYEEEYEEEEVEEVVLPKKKKEKKKQQSHSVIMGLFDEDIEDGTKQKYDHDIPLAFEEKDMKQETIKPQEMNKTEETKNSDFIDANLFKETKEEKEEKTKQELQLEHAQMEIDQNYEFPPIALLEQGDIKKARGSKTSITENAVKLQKTLHSFGVSAKVEDVSVGPAITRYELKPAEGVRVSKIANLADDIALNLAAQSIRIEAPIPRKTSCWN